MMSEIRCGVDAEVCPYCPVRSPLAHSPTQDAHVASGETWPHAAYRPDFSPWFYRSRQPMTHLWSLCTASHHVVAGGAAHDEA
jgi:hypothetical protein